MQEAPDNVSKEHTPSPDERQTAGLLTRRQSKTQSYLCLSMGALLISTSAWWISWNAIQIHHQRVQLMPATYASDEKWLRYLQRVYKNSYPNTTTFPVDLSYLRCLHMSVLRDVGLDVSFPDCTLTTQSGDLYRYRAGYPFESNDYAFIAGPPLQPLPANTWVEVTHCPKDYEIDVYWMYHSPGSGVWVNTGTTLVLNSFDEVCRYMGQPNKCWRTASGQISISGLDRLPEQMTKFDTLQVLRHHGDDCAARHLELVHLRYPGNQTCGPPMRTGWNAQLSCRCSASKDDTACAVCI